jgi:hypothetical protein
MMVLCTRVAGWMVNRRVRAHFTFQMAEWKRVFLRMTSSWNH